MSAPPLLVGAVHVAVIFMFPPVAVSPVGIPGTVAGVSEAASDHVPSPTTFLARTRTE